LVRTRFDVVLMNPPFGAASLAAKKEFEKAYPRTKNDIYAAFVERGHPAPAPARDAGGDHVADGLLPVELSKSGARRSS
jgi:predicted RNA methylase